uniref:Fucolectin tachylectin-4 pentraxin-1 domain-containing protein n=1 Tax=Sinocyclocheilus grahami TaxID=75366 RepID=A0A672K3X8_SINGR
MIRSKGFRHTQTLLKYYNEWEQAKCTFWWNESCLLKSVARRNLATGKNVTQSSTYGLWSAEQAIDSNPGFRKSWSSCSSTDNQTNPWWRVDLSSVYRVNRVVITNRLDCCPERINGAEIHPLSVGRYVNLFIPGDSKYLTLCEVEVYGEGGIKQADLVF